MSSNQGWVSLHRSISEWEWYSDGNTFRLFIHLLISANHKDNKWRGIDVKKGSLVTGRTKLSEALGLSVQQIRTSLDRLKSTSEITIKTTNKFSIISITNWALYQDKEAQVTSKATNEQPSNNHQSTTNNNENNENNENKQIKQTPLAMLTDMNIDQALASEWLKVRKTKRLAATQTAFDATKKQADIAGIDFNAAIKLCVEESWGGFKAEWLVNKKGVNNGTRSNQGISKQPDNSATRHHDRLKALHVQALADELDNETVQQVSGDIQPQMALSDRH